MKIYFNFIWISVFSLLLIVPAISLFDIPNKEKFTRIERRDSAEFPNDLNLNSLKKFESYFNDHTLYRFETLKYLGKFYYYFKTSMNPLYAIVGTGKFVFLGDYYDGGISKYRGIGTYKALPLNFSKRIKEFFSAAEFIDSAKMLVIAPDKHVVYQEFLPSWIKENIEEKRVNKLKIFLAESHLNNFLFLDLKEALQTEKDNFNFPVYYENDSHWNYVGGFIGFKAILSELKKFIGFENIKFPNSFVFEDAYSESLKAGKKQGGKEGDMSNFLQLGIQSFDPRPLLQTKDSWKIDKDGEIEKLNNYEWIEASSWTQRFLNSSAVNKKRVLILGDSYSEMIAPYFVEAFEDVTILHYQKVLELREYTNEQLIKNGHYDLVLILMVQRVI